MAMYSTLLVGVWLRGKAIYLVLSGENPTYGSPISPKSSIFALSERLCLDLLLCLPFLIGRVYNTFH